MFLYNANLNIMTMSEMSYNCTSSSEKYFFSIPYKNVFAQDASGILASLCAFVEFYFVDFTVN